jgi:membrane-associated phospholipid phosphatase
MKMKFLIATCLLIPFLGFSQKPDTLIKKLDSLTESKKTDSAGVQNNNISKEAYNENTKITLSSYFILLGSDLKQEVTAPFHWSKKDWGKAAKFTLLTGALLFADEPIERGAVKLRNNSKTVSNVSTWVSRFGGDYETYTLAAFGAYGFIFKNQKIKTTTLLATQAYITGGAMEGLLKFLTGRQRPSFYDSTSGEVEPKWHGPFYKTGVDRYGQRVNSSFPSGHTTVAFAAATVFAMEYKGIAWVPIFSYSVATLIGISRITNDKHWATDVLAGAALGYFTGRQVVNNYHRFAKLKAPQEKKGSVSFNLQFNNGHLMPGLVYTFR